MKSRIRARLISVLHIMPIDKNARSSAGRNTCARLIYDGHIRNCANGETFGYDKCDPSAPWLSCRSRDFLSAVSRGFTFQGTIQENRRLYHMSAPNKAEQTLKK